MYNLEYQYLYIFNQAITLEFIDNLTGHNKTIRKEIKEAIENFIFDKANIIILDSLHGLS
jgi:hypothetical protein